MTLPQDLQFLIVKTACLMELTDQFEAMFEDERSATIRRLLIVVSATKAYHREQESYLSNQLVTHGFGPGNKYAECLMILFDATLNRADKFSKLYAHAKYDTEAYHTVLEEMAWFYPSIPLINWDAIDNGDYEEYETQPFVHATFTADPKWL